MTFASMTMMKGIWLSIAFILVSDYPVVVDDKDVYPVEVVERNLNLVYYDEHLIDVLLVHWMKSQTQALNTWSMP
jgi:urease accessory protein